MCHNNLQTRLLDYLAHLQVDSSSAEKNYMETVHTLVSRNKL